MAKIDFKLLLQQAEKELECITPGAYCHRKVAVRAMELLMALASKDASEAVSQTIDTANQKIEKLVTEVKDSKATIERQARALTELQRPSAGALGRPGAYGQRSPMDEAIYRRQEEENRRRTLELEREKARYSPQYYQNPAKRTLDYWFKEARQL